MVGLRIELRCKSDYVLARNQLLFALEAHAEGKVVEPLDHARPRVVEAPMQIISLALRYCPNSARAASTRARIGAGPNWERMRFAAVRCSSARERFFLIL